jgi:hypothetical protein
MFITKQYEDGQYGFESEEFELVPTSRIISELKESGEWEELVKLWEEQKNA